MNEQFLNEANTAIYDYFILHLQTCMMPFFLTNHVEIANKKNSAIYYLQNINKEYAIYILEKNAEYLATPSNKEQVYRAFSFLVKSVNIKNKFENTTIDDNWITNKPNSININLNDKSKEINKEKLVSTIPDPRTENKNFNNKKYVRKI